MNVSAAPKVMTSRVSMKMGNARTVRSLVSDPYLMNPSQIRRKITKIGQKWHRGTVPNGSIGDVQNQVFGAGTDANFGAPDAQARADIVTGVAASVMAP